MISCHLNNFNFQNNKLSRVEEIQPKTLTNIINYLKVLKGFVGFSRGSSLIRVIKDPLGFSRVLLDFWGSSRVLNGFLRIYRIFQGRPANSLGFSSARGSLRVLKSAPQSPQGSSRILESPKGSSRVLKGSKGFQGSWKAHNGTRGSSRVHKDTQEF